MQDRILVVDDDPLVLDVVAAALERESFQVSKVRDGASALELLRREPHELVLCDMRMPGVDGNELLGQVSRQHPGTDVVIMTGYATREGALDALARGAADYLVKPLSPKDVVQTCRGILERRRLESELRAVKSQLRSRFEHHNIVAVSPRMEALLAALGRLSESDAPVLLCGEVGTGRRFFARTLHQTGRRREQPYAEIPCDTTPADGVHRDLVGAHPPGERLRRGRLERLAEGTLHLYRAELLEPELQSWLADILERGEYRRPGVSQPLPLRTRMILSLSGAPDELVEQGRLVPGLARAGDCVTVHVPPLASRVEDIPGLVRVFLDMHAVENGRAVQVTPATVELLSRQRFPGNVRQLFATLMHCASLVSDGMITPELAERSLRKADLLADATPMAKHLGDREFEVLRKAIGKHSRLDDVARHLGISRTTLWRRMRKYGLQGGE